MIFVFLILVGLAAKFVMMKSIPNENDEDIE